jgi:predicted small secreted protein
MQTKWGKNLRKDKKFEEIDMRLSVVKPLHASWLVKTHKQLKEKTDLIKSAFVATGITCNQTDKDNHIGHTTDLSTNINS